ncbi:DUF1566 domain-containing protein [Pseudoalteromonas ulvae]|uniref:Lcl C-terminal domain-containing protein n=1 Tax=Pseudoalteromonas ulvae TaxID=107327 RepID=A0A244CUQ1_PSEDV|nr:DUF1566 domain-containing protein [Pseudoalteromonas ulvae]OUL59347.1 hypothetical protein B1199_03510 [Pseudoalteromonas ulvae]
MKKRILISLFLIVGLLYLGALQTSPTPLTDPNWQKISSQGQPLGPWQGPWACIFDKRQQLFWETKTDDESIHDGNWTYSWFQNGIGKENHGDCYFEDKRCDTDDLIRRTNQQQLCGQTQWRLPTQAELLALKQTQDRPGQIAITTDYFIHMKHGDYWSSTHHQPLSGIFGHLKHGAVAVNMTDVSAVTLPYRNAAFVILVSEASSAP